MEHKFITLSYKLYTISEGKKGLIEQTSADEPFEFISGFGIALDEFERQVVGLEKGAEFDFTLTKVQAYGEYFDDRVVDLDREIFCIDGKFDTDHVYTGAAIPLLNEQGDRFMGRVIDITDEKVVVDLNHPLAGQELQFVGQIIDTRDATEEEIIKTINGGCGCCGGDCGGCEEDGDGQQKEKKHGGCGRCGKR